PERNRNGARDGRRRAAPRRGSTAPQRARPGKRMSDSHSSGRPALCILLLAELPSSCPVSPEAEELNRPPFSKVKGLSGSGHCDRRAVDQSDPTAETEGEATKYPEIMLSDERRALFVI